MRPTTVAFAALMSLAAGRGARASSPRQEQEAPPHEEHSQHQAGEHSPHLEVDAETGFHGGGAGLGVGVSAEWERLGLEGKVDALQLHPHELHTPWRETVALLTLMPSLELLGGEAGHVRVLAGMDAAFADGHFWVGPGMGLQLDAALLGPLDAEVAAEVTPLPFTRMDAQAGLAVHLGQLAVRGGWRHMVLNDHGMVDGVVHEDVLTGPYVGMGLEF